MRRREFLTRTAAFAAAGGMAVRARAEEEWPQRQVTIVVPFSAGGSADLIGRLLGQHLQAKFGVPFVIENRGGAGGSIGTAVVAKAPPRRLHPADRHGQHARHQPFALRQAAVRRENAISSRSRSWCGCPIC